MAPLLRGLEAEKYDRSYSDRALVSRITRYFRPHKGKALIVIASIFLMAAAVSALPLVVAEGLNNTLNDSLTFPFLLVGLVFATRIAIWGLNWVRRRYASEVISDVIMAMRSDAFDAAVEQDLSFYDEYNSGRIVSRITSDTQEFGDVLNIATDVVNQLSVALILIVVLFSIDVRLSLLVVAMAPVVVAAALGFRRAARQVTRQSSRALAEVNKSIQEAVTGIRVAKNFRQEQAIYDDFMQINQQSYRINIRRGFLMALIFPVLNVLAGIGAALLIYIGGGSVVAGVLSVAAWYLFVATADRFWFPIIDLSAFWSQFQAGLAATERVFALIDSEAAVTQIAGNPAPILEGSIVFDNVSFAYSTQEQVLNGFNLHIRPGESVALVGHTGAGKSSIVKLVGRFYEFQSGQIRADDHDIRTFDLPSYRRQLGVVTQVPFLFDGTVADNIRYACPDATDEQIEATARQIGEGEWLDTLPDGIRSQVGERGARLSMGQRQLVALTRVLVQNPRIFLLDEATASVDPFTESQIQQALDLIMHHRTAVIIAHRLSTVRSADRIIVLQKGRVIEEGNHQQLMAQRGHYAELYDTYFRHQSLEAIDRPSWRASQPAPRPAAQHLDPMPQPGD